MFAEIPWWIEKIENDVLEKEWDWSWTNWPSDFSWRTNPFDKNKNASRGDEKVIDGKWRFVRKQG